MNERVAITGVGHAVGSESVSNRQLARTMNLPDDWFVTRTGIEERRVCSAGETVLTLAQKAIKNACEDAQIRCKTLKAETILLHIQNGFTHGTPPPGIVLCNSLGLHSCRTMSIDGVCAEPINALEIAELLLLAHRCDRVIVSASVDFTPIISPRDRGTVGLFGAGAGALVLERQPADAPGIEALHWETQSKHWDLGVIELLGTAATDDAIEVHLSYYRMNGKKLARVCMRTLPRVLRNLRDRTQWGRNDVDLYVTHQPNAKLLELGIKRLGLEASRVPRPVTNLGNMGPASVLVNLSIARQNGLVRPGTKVVLIAFGLGFSCGAAAITF